MSARIDAIRAVIKEFPFGLTEAKSIVEFVIPLLANNNLAEVDSETARYLEERGLAVWNVSRLVDIIEGIVPPSTAPTPSPVPEDRSIVEEKRSGLATALRLVRETIEDARDALEEAEREEEDLLADIAALERLFPDPTTTPSYSPCG